MSKELIQLAADNSKGSYPLSRIYTLLEKWYRAGITDVAAAQNTLNTSGQTRQNKVKENPALKYEQRDYRDDDFDGDDIMDAVRRIVEQQDAGSEGN